MCNEVWRLRLAIVQRKQGGREQRPCNMYYCTMNLCLEIESITFESRNSEIFGY
jgi:hypothetical protein